MPKKTMHDVRADEELISIDGTNLDLDGLTIVNADLTDPTNTVLGGGGGGSSPPIVSANIDAGQNVNTAMTCTLTQTRADTGWVVAADSLTFTGTPDRVRIAANCVFTGSVTRANPVMGIYRSGTLIAEAASGYIRNSSGHTEASGNIAVVDAAPGVNPSYEVRFRQEAGTGSVLSVAGASIQAEAVT